MFWKVFLVLGVGFFAVVSAWVTIAGLFDIRRMFAQLREGDPDDSGD